MLALLDLALDQLVVGRVDVLVERGRDLLHLEGREEAVVDALLERVDVDRLAEVGVGVDVVLALGRRRHAELHRRREVVEDAAPVALVVGAAAVALVDDDEVEEVGRVLAEVGRGSPSFAGPLMKVWKMVKKRLPFLGTLPFLRDVGRGDAHHRVLGEGGEGVVGLVGEDVAVGEEEDARAARGLAGQVPAAVEELPGDLEGDEGLAGAGGQREQDALLAGGDRLHDALDGDVLVVAARVRAALVLEGHGGEAVAPGVRLGEGERPELVGRGVAAAARPPRRSPCRCRRCPGRWWRRRSARPACRRSPWPGRRPR